MLSLAAAKLSRSASARCPFPDGVAADSLACGRDSASRNGGLLVTITAAFSTRSAMT